MWENHKRRSFAVTTDGRELLSLMGLGAKREESVSTLGNIIKQAETAEKAGIVAVEFISCNILDIPKEYHHSFDFVLFTA